MKRILCVVAVAVVLLTGCAKAPQENIISATKAIAEAKAAGAEKYAKEQLAEVEKMMSGALQEITKQNKALFNRNYEQASKMLGEVAVKAAEVASAAKAAAAQASKDNAEALINNIYAAYQKALKAFSKNANAKPQLNAAMANLKDAQTAMKKADYTAAVDAARKAEAKIVAVTSTAGK